MRAHRRRRPRAWAPAGPSPPARATIRDELGGQAGSRGRAGGRGAAARAPRARGGRARSSGPVSQLPYVPPVDVPRTASSPRMCARVWRLGEEVAAGPDLADDVERQRASSTGMPAQHPADDRRRSRRRGGAARTTRSGCREAGPGPSSMSEPDDAGHEAPTSDVLHAGLPVGRLAPGRERAHRQRHVGRSRRARRSQRRTGSPRARRPCRRRSAGPSPSGRPRSRRGAPGARAASAPAPR